MTDQCDDLADWYAVYGPYASRAEALAAHAHATGDDQPDIVPETQMR